MKPNPKIEKTNFYNELLEFSSSNLVIDEKHLLYKEIVSKTSDEDENENIETKIDTQAHPIELRKLIDLIDNTKTSWGNEFLLDSILNPSTNLDEIQAKQDALREISNNETLKENLSKYLNFVKETIELENKDPNGEITGLRNGVDSFLRYTGRSNLKSLEKLICESNKNITTSKNIKSNYLKKIIKDINNLEKSDIGKFSKGIKFKQWGRDSVYSYKELKLDVPIPFLPIPMPTGFLGIGAGIYSILSNETIRSQDSPFFAIALLTLVVTGGIGIISTVDSLFQDKIKKRYENDLDFKKGIKSIGKLDELLSYEQMRTDLISKNIPVCLPTMIDSKKHQFTSKKIINLIEKTEQNISNYIPNDVNLSGITFYTGPNSGGKTSLAKAIAQAQILAQAGGYIPTSSATISIADKICYQVGTNDTQTDKEGGFGTQIKKTKNIFYNSSPQTLIIIDDLIDGTSFKDKTEISTDQLSGFTHIGSNLIYVSHHNELAEIFEKQNSGSFYQIEYKNNKPTHKLIPGICTESHANEVASKIGFGSEDIKNHLISKGYISNNRELRNI
ncbi:MAG: hypothetical protein HRU03_03445 [Nanoarchaeales archaeon]|nr:hypothetical protein [Nanoarchaeales archaeon]